jgi:hypothetical protein
MLTRLLFEVGRQEYVQDVVKNSEEQRWVEEAQTSEPEETPQVETESSMESEASWEEAGLCSTLSELSLSDHANHESVLSHRNNCTFVARGTQISLYNEA